MVRITIGLHINYLSRRSIHSHFLGSSPVLCIQFVITNLVTRLYLQFIQNTERQEGSSMFYFDVLSSAIQLYLNVELIFCRVCLHVVVQGPAKLFSTEFQLSSRLIRLLIVDQTPKHNCYSRGSWKAVFNISVVVVQSA